MIPEPPGSIKIELEYTGNQERPAFTNLGDIFKSIQSVFNYFAESEGIQDSTLRINKLESGSILVEAVFSMPEEFVRTVFLKLQAIWNAHAEEKQAGVLEQLELSGALLEFLEKNDLDIQKITYQDIDKLPDREKDELESIDPDFSRKLKLVTHVRRASNWKIIVH